MFVKVIEVYKINFEYWKYKNMINWYSFMKYLLNFWNLNRLFVFFCEKVCILLFFLGFEIECKVD